MAKTDINKVNNFLKSEEKYKEAHYEYLTTFAYVEMLMSYCVSSYYCEKNEEKIEFTTSLLMQLSRPKLYEEFLLVLEKEKIQKDQIFDKFINLNKLRNDFAHTYFVPKKENLKNGFCITKIFSTKNPSSIEGFSKIIQDKEYEKNINDLNLLKERIYFIFFNYFKI